VRLSGKSVQCCFVASLTGAFKLATMRAAQIENLRSGIKLIEAFRLQRKKIPLFIRPKSAATFRVLP
jgi:hypothetical protein